MSLTRRFQISILGIMLTLVGVGLLSQPVYAQDLGSQYDDIMDQGIIFANICGGSSVSCDCRDKGQCTLEDILQVGVNIGVLILGISGSVVLLIFVYGGYMWVTAAGDAGRVKTGRDSMVGAVVGLAIVFGAYAAITFAISVIKTGEPPSSGETLEDVIGGGADTIIETSTE